MSQEVATAYAVVPNGVNGTNPEESLIHGFWDVSSWSPPFPLLAFPLLDSPHDPS